MKHCAIAIFMGMLAAVHGYGQSADATTAVALENLTVITEAARKASESGDTGNPGALEPKKPAPTPTPTPLIPLPALDIKPTPTPRGRLWPEPDDLPLTALPTPVNYFFPDAPAGIGSVNGKYGTLNLNFAMLADFTYISQDEINREQVGPQASKGDLRAGRIVFSGLIKFKRPWIYVVAINFDRPSMQSGRLVDPLDVNLTIPLWRKARLTIGKQKESFVYELGVLSAFLPQQERLLNPFFVTRNVGIKYAENYFNDKLTFRVGVFNEFLQQKLKFKDSGMQVSGRITTLPIASRNGREYLHLGLALRYNGADKGELRFRGRPESNVTDYYIDTGNFSAKYSKQMVAAALYNKRSFSILAEYTQAWVKSAEKQNPSFHGYYFTGSYILTGENRPYDKANGYAKNIIPRSRWGAVELVSRFGQVDLDDNLVKGGKLTKIDVGVNWWASQQWKLGTIYGLALLNRFDTTGTTHAVHMRLQWIY